MTKGYYQFPMTDETKDLTSFLTPCKVKYGSLMDLYHFNCLHLGAPIFRIYAFRLYKCSCNFCQDVQVSTTCIRNTVSYNDDMCVNAILQITH